MASYTSRRHRVRSTQFGGNPTAVGHQIDQRDIRQTLTKRQQLGRYLIIVFEAVQNIANVGQLLEIDFFFGGQDLL